MLDERVSKNLGIKFVVLNRKDRQYMLCEKGVVFTKEEYINKFNTSESLQKEYKRRLENETLYDYEYAKETGLIRLLKNVPIVPEKAKEKISNSIIIMCVLLFITSIGSMYISTVHTATYLFDYVDIVSAWIMSAVTTIYCSTAFEVVILFQERKRYILSSIFALLWAIVVLFSMVTTVSVFYDRYNFNTLENQTENTELDGTRLSLSILQTKEKDLRHSISLKEDDIEYRRSLDYATTAVRQELNVLQDMLQDNLTEQQSILSATPTASKAEDEAQKKETLFVYIGRAINVDGGILSFIMSTLSAVFINLISPFTVTSVISLLNKKE